MENYIQMIALCLRAIPHAGRCSKTKNHIVESAFEAKQIPSQLIKTWKERGITTRPALDQIFISTPFKDKMHDATRGTTPISPLLTRPPKETSPIFYHGWRHTVDQHFGVLYSEFVLYHQASPNHFEVNAIGETCNIYICPACFFDESMVYTI